MCFGGGGGELNEEENLVCMKAVPVKNCFVRKFCKQVLSCQTTLNMQIVQYLKKSVISKNIRQCVHLQIYTLSTRQFSEVRWA